MKKILLGFALMLATLSFAQQYPNNGWGDDGYYDNDGYYSDDDDRNYFPDDYYYNYPQDYYPNAYYQSYYNDYRNSIVSINWNVFFNQYRLSPWQIDQILRLNNLYVSFSAWNNFYRYNPDRWYYDRFYALERIMGPRIFVIFRNNYYRGYSPIVYFQNYRRTYYTPRFRPMPRYRNVNINIYRVDRAKFRRMDNPTLNIIRTSDRERNGFRRSVREGNSGFRGQTENKNNSGGFRSDNNGIKNNGEFRGNSGNNGGFRGDTDNGGHRSNGGFRGNNEIRRESAPKRNDNGGFRNGGGFKRNESSAPREQNRGNGNGNGRGGGFRSGFAKN